MLGGLLIAVLLVSLQTNDWAGKTLHFIQRHTGAESLETAETIVS
jgi:hypothetical protein